MAEKNNNKNSNKTEKSQEVKNDQKVENLEKTEVIEKPEKVEGHKPTEKDEKKPTETKPVDHTKKQKAEKKPKAPMSAKTRNIVITIVCVAVLLAGIITSIILATRKRFEIDNYLKTNYNNHTVMELLDYNEEQLSGADENVYTNGMKIVSRDAKYGLYSLTQDKMVADLEYSKISVLKELENDTLFKLEVESQYKIVNDLGNDTGLVYAQDGKMYGYKMSKNISTVRRKSEVRVRVSDEFTKEKVEITDIELLTQMYVKGHYNYEIWKLTSEDSIEYTNLYKVVNGERQLVQTLGLTEGIGYTSNDYNFFISSDGTPYIQEINKIMKESELIAVTYTIYNINYEKIGTFKLDNQLLSNTAENSFVTVGDTTYFQTIQDGTEEEHDFYDTSSTEITYHKIKTYKIELTKARISEESCKFVIVDSYSKSSILSGKPTVSKTTTITAREIKDKELMPEKILIVNEKLQTKAVDYIRENTLKISNNRYIVSDTNDCYYIIDNKFNLVSTLGEIDGYFTTSDSIIITIDNTNNSIADGTTYVCDYNGVIIKKYNQDEIENIYHEDYYLVKEVVEENGVSKNRYYLEQCGLREENYIYETYTGMTSYYFKDQVYVKQFTNLINNEISVIIRVREQENGKYAYEFYNLENALLFILEDTQNLSLSFDIKYSDEDCVILYSAFNAPQSMAGGYFKLDR